MTFRMMKAHAMMALLAASVQAQGVVTLPLAFKENNGTEGYRLNTFLDQTANAPGEWYDGLNGAVYNDVIAGFNIGMTMEATSTWLPTTTDPNRYWRAGTDDV